MASDAATTPAEALFIESTSAVIRSTARLVAVTAVLMASSDAPAWAASSDAVFDLGRAGGHGLDGFFGAGLDLADESGDLLGGATGSLGELADLVGDDCEALALLAGSGRLDGGVEGEEVGLLGDVVDRLDDGADLVGLGAELGDLPRGLLDGELDAFHLADGLADGLLAVVGGFGGGGGHGADFGGCGRGAT